MSAEVTLKNALNPVALFHKIFVEHVIRPMQESRRQMHLEHVGKERMIIKQLVAARSSAQFIRDARMGLIHFVGKNIPRNEPLYLVMDTAAYG